MKPVNQRPRSVWRRILGCLVAGPDSLYARLERLASPSSTTRRVALRRSHRWSSSFSRRSFSLPPAPTSRASPSVACEIRRGALIGTLACGLPVALAARASLAVGGGAVVFALFAGCVVGALIGLLLWLGSDELYAEPVVPAPGVQPPRRGFPCLGKGSAHNAPCAPCRTPISALGAVRRRSRRPR
jgi:hypothetical protein